MSSGKTPNFNTTASSASSLAELKAICKEYGIKNTVDYKQKYKDIPGLPAHPERLFNNEWSSYSEFFDIPQVIPYRELKGRFRRKALKTNVNTGHGSIR